MATCLNWDVIVDRPALMCLQVRFVCYRNTIDQNKCIWLALSAFSSECWDEDHADPCRVYLQPDCMFLNLSHTNDFYFFYLNENSDLIEMKTRRHLEHQSIDQGTIYWSVCKIKIRLCDSKILQCETIWPLVGCLTIIFYNLKIMRILFK